VGLLTYQENSPGCSPKIENRGGCVVVGGFVPTRCGGWGWGSRVVVLAPGPLRSSQVAVAVRE